MAEFALITPIFILMLFMAITFAFIGEAALSVNQLAFAGARYAAVNPALNASEVAAYIKSGHLGSPTITANGGAHLTVSVVPASGFGQPLTVTVAYDLTSNALVSQMSALFSAIGLGQSLPTNLTATQSAMSE